jgi:hypothetical protein
VVEGTLLILRGDLGSPLVPAMTCLWHARSGACGWWQGGLLLMCRSQNRTVLLPCAQGKWVRHRRTKYRGLYNSTRDCPAWVQEWDCMNPQSPQWHPHPPGEAAYNLACASVPPVKTPQMPSVLLLSACIAVTKPHPMTCLLQVLHCGSQHV